MELLMSAHNHETERLLRRIRQLQTDYEIQEKQKENALKTLAEQLEIAQKRIVELESKYIKNETD
jgi:hypothetical protein